MPFGSYWYDTSANLHRTENLFVKAAREDLWSEPSQRECCKIFRIRNKLMLWFVTKLKTPGKKK